MRSFFTLPNFFYGIEDECCEIYCGFFDLFLYVRFLVPSFSPLHRNAAAAASCLPINPAESNPALLFLGSATWLIKTSSPVPAHHASDRDTVVVLTLKILKTTTRTTCYQQNKSTQLGTTCAVVQFVGAIHASHTLIAITND